METSNPFADPNFGAPAGAGGNPFSDPNFGVDPERGMPTKLVRAAARGAGAEASGIGKTLGLAASAPFMAFDAARGMVSGRPETGAQDWAFQHLVDPMARTAQGFAPTQEEAASIPLSIAHGLGSMAVDLPLIALTGGKAGLPEAVSSGARLATMGEMAVNGMKAMAPVAVSHAVGQAGAAMEQGVDLPTAYASGAVTGATSTLMGALPMSLRGGLVTRAASGAASSAVTGEIERQGQNAVLSNYPTMHSELTPQGVATNLAMGALLGSVLGPRPEKLAVKKAKVDTKTLLDQTDPNQSKPALQIGNTPDPLLSFPDGTVGRRSEVDAYINGLPPEQQTAARAKAMGLAPQPAPLEIDPAITAKLAQTLPDGETAPTVPIKGLDASHDAAIAQIYDVGEVPTGIPQQDRARADALSVGTKAPLSLDGHVPTAMELAWEKAQITAAAEEAKSGITGGFDSAEQGAVAAKSQQLDAIQNIAKGDQLAGAAGQGEVPNLTLRKPTTDFMAELQGVLPDGMTKSTKTTVERELSRMVEGKETFDDQLAAIAVKVASLEKTKPQRYEFFKSLYDKLTEGKAKPNEEATPTVEAAKAIEAQPAPAEGGPPALAGLEIGKPAAAEVRAPDATAVAPAPEAAPALAVPTDTPRDQAMVKVQAARGIFAKVEADFDARLNAGETLSTSEQQRYNESTAMSAALEQAVGARGAPAHLEALAGYARESETPQAWAKADKSHLSRMADPEAPDPALTQVIQASSKLSDTLTHIEDNGSTPTYRELAGKLRTFDLPTTIDSGELPPGYKPNAVGGYDANADHVRVPPGGATETTVLHEAVHAASFPALELASKIDIPRNQQEAQQKTAYAKWEALRQEAQQKAGADSQYGLSDAHEFMAELHTNLEFQQFLARKSLWARAVDGVRNLLGLSPRMNSMLERAMDLQGSFFGKQQYEAAKNAAPPLIRDPLKYNADAPQGNPLHATQGYGKNELIVSNMTLKEARASEAKFWADKDARENAARAQVKTDNTKFNLSVTGAADVIERRLLSLVKQDEEFKAKTGLARFQQVVAQKMLPAETVQFMADWARANPLLKAFSAGTDKYVAAFTGREIAGVYTSADAGKYTHKVDAMLRKLPRVESDALKMNLSEITTGSSFMGVDPQLNFAKNLERIPDLDASNKPYIDLLNRKFTQLQRSNPEAASAALEGALVNRKLYVMKSSSVISNLLNVVTGNAIKLETELAHMNPADADFARMEARVLSARQEANLAVTHAPGLDLMAKGLGAERNGDAARHLDGASYVLDQRLNAVFADAELLPAGSVLRDQLLDWQFKYDNQIANPYYHAGRSGDFFVNVGWKGMDDATWAKMQGTMEGSNKVLGSYEGQDHAYFRVDTAAQAAGMRKKLEAAMGNYADIGKSLSGKQADFISNSNSGISAALRSVITTLDDNIKSLGLQPSQAAAMRDVMTKQVLSMLPETSARQATIKRAQVPGYDGDFNGNFTRHAMSEAHDIANIYSMRDYTAAFRSMTDSIETLSRSGDIQTQENARSVADEFMTRYHNSLLPVDNRAVNTINSVAYPFYIAASPAYLIRNFAQMWHQSLPHLGSLYGFASSAAELAKTSAMAVKIIAASIREGRKEGGLAGVLDMGVTLKGLGLPPGLEAFVTELHDQGRLDFGQAKQLQTMAMGGNTRKNDVIRMLSSFATYSEMMNRLTVGMAAYNLAERSKPGFAGERGHAASTAYALGAIDKTLGNFDPNNTARIFSKHAPVTGKITPLLTMFMEYNAQTTQSIARMVHEGMFNQDKTPEGVQRSTAAKKELLGLTATTTMLAGVMGLPFVSAFAGIYNMLAKDEDQPSDIRQSVRDFMADNMGVQLGGVAAHGLGTAAGVDMSTFGLRDLLPGSNFLADRRILKDKLSSASENMMGPALNGGMDLAQGLAMMSDGYYAKGIGQMLPSALKGYWKAYQLADKGPTDSKGNPIGMDVTPWDIGIQATGLRPSTLAVQAEGTQYKNVDQGLLDYRRGVITDQIYKSFQFGDAGDQRDAMAALQKFNTANPTTPIRDIASVFRQHAMTAAMGRATGTGIGFTKQQMPTMAPAARFAVQGGMQPRQ